jgi:hypothetical protein
MDAFEAICQATVLFSKSRRVFLLFISVPRHANNLLIRMYLSQLTMLKTLNNTITL